MIFVQDGATSTITNDGTILASSGSGVAIRAVDADLIVVKNGQIVGQTVANGEFGAAAAEHSSTLLNNGSGTVETGLLNDFDI